MQIKEVT